MEPTSHLLEEFVLVKAPMERVEAVMTERDLMRRWMSGAVQFEPLDGWRFDQGAPWRLTLTGLGRILEATYLVQERRPGLVLWAFDGFWEGFDAWHWLPQLDGRTLIQNRVEYRLRLPALDLFWPATVGPLMGWDAKVQMQRLRQVCEGAQ
ncbi:MAG: SRPBCC family protein [Oscillochloridaceae bacterium umkhey_bin13]